MHPCCRVLVRLNYFLCFLYEFNSDVVELNGEGWNYCSHPQHLQAEDVKLISRWLVGVTLPLGTCGYDSVLYMHRQTSQDESSDMVHFRAKLQTVTWISLVRHID